MEHTADIYESWVHARLQNSADLMPDERDENIRVAQVYATLCQAAATEEASRAQHGLPPSSEMSSSDVDLTNTPLGQYPFGGN